MSDHTHPALDDRITAEMALIRTEIAGMRGDLSARIDVVERELVGLRRDTQRGFSAVTQVLGQILERLGLADDDT